MDITLEPHEVAGLLHIDMATRFPGDLKDEKMDEDELSERDSLDWEPSNINKDYYDLDMMFDPYDDKVASIESSVIKKVAKRFR